MAHLMTNRLTLLILLAPFFIACVNRTPDYQTIVTDTGRWELVWNDEFDYRGFPDSTKWSFDTEGNKWNWGNNELQHYTKNNADNAYVSDGLLTITARIDSMGGKRYTSARLLSKGKGDWLYGRFEIRAKLPTGVGTWPAIWMLPTDNVYGGWPDSGEIDIMENVGYDPDTIVSTAHTRTYNHMLGTQTSGLIEVPTCHSGFHTYILEWEADEYRVYEGDQNPRCRIASKVSTAVDTDTLSESIFPRMGILIRFVAFLSQKSDKPSASVPITMAEGREKSVC